MAKKLFPFVKNFYVLGTLLFIVWMLFLDQNDFVSRYKLSAKLHSLKNERTYYQEKIEQVQKDHDDLFGDRESLEKFAREKYLMKKENEEIFLLTEEE